MLVLSKPSGKRHWAHVLVLATAYLSLAAVFIIFEIGSLL